MEIKKYKGKHTLKIKLKDKTLSIEPDTALGVMQRGDKLYILHQQRNAVALDRVGNPRLRSVHDVLVALALRDRADALQVLSSYDGR